MQAVVFISDKALGKFAQLILGLRADSAQVDWGLVLAFKQAARAQQKDERQKRQLPHGYGNLP